MLTKFRPLLRRAVSTLQRPAKRGDSRIVSFRPKLEGFEDRTLLASSLLLSGFPASVTAGVAGNLTVTAKNADGTLDTAYGGTISFSSADGQAGLPANYTFSALDLGVHVFSVTLKTAGSQSVTATDTVTSTITGSQSSITVNPAAASSLVVSGFASPSTAGTAGTVTVTAKDAYGNTATGYLGTVSFTSSDSQAALPANYAFVASDAGVHSFNATLKTAGSKSITATDTVTSTITGSQSGITVNPAAASSLVVSGFASPSTAGTAGTVTVTAKDAYSNTATGYTGTVSFTSSDAQAALPANYIFVAADAGVHAFSATLKTAASQSITATDTVTSTITGSQTGITVNPAAASSLVVSGIPSPVSSGDPRNVTVTAKDPYGNTATGYLGTVIFTSSDILATLPANYAFVAADAGVHSFVATLSTVATQTLTATDLLNPTITGQQSGIIVKPTWAHPELITISFIPDGTLMTSGLLGNVYSNTFSKLNPKGAWQNAVLTAAQTWAAVANVNFDVVSDNGTTSGQGNYEQGDPNMGDIRVGGYNFGNSYLAGAYLAPSTNNYSIAGDFNFNTGQNLNIGSTYDIQTVALHELGHSLGLGHTTLNTTVMYPSYHGVFRSLSSTDISNIQAIYGTRQPDAYNTNPATANTSFANAASLNGVLTNQTAVVNNLSINSTTQAEYFTFTAPATTGSTLTVTAQSAGLSMFTPSVKIYAADQSTVLGSASSTVQYKGVTVSASATGVTAGEQFYVKVTGVDSSAFSTGAFALTLNFGSGSGPAVTLPNTQVTNGATLQGGGGLGLDGLLGLPLKTLSTILSFTGLTYTKPTMDYMAPSVDLIPPSCLGHGGGCGCPACRAAVSRVKSPSALEPQQQPAMEIGWTRGKHRSEQRTLDAVVESGTWAERNKHEGIAATVDQASTGSWREACDAYFDQASNLEAIL